MEFRVERVGGRGGHVLDDFGECFVGGDPPDRRRRHAITSGWSQW